jgi:hypothetical protein
MIQDKMVVKGVSVKQSQVIRVGKFVDLSRHGQWSQFIQDALDEKLGRLEKQPHLKEDKKAS